MTASPASGVLRQAREERFAAVYRSNHSDVLRFLARRTSAERAEDLAHEAFLIAWRRLDDIPSNAADARAWLFTVARNCLLNDRRGIARHGGISVPLGPDADLDAPALEDGIIAKVDIAAAWGTLTAAEQEVIALHVWDDLTSPQAGRVLGITSAAYRLRLHRARAALRVALAHETNEPTLRPLATHRPAKESS